MLPQPLHPAVVHFPIVLAFLLPVASLFALWAIRRGTAPARAWALPVALAAALTLSAWVAIETGEDQEDRVEAVVPERLIDRHAEAAERFLVLAGIVLAVAGLGLLRGTLGSSARLLATAGAVGLLIATYQVGSEGGDLVYRHGAASAYTQEAGVEGRR